MSTSMQRVRVSMRVTLPEPGQRVGVVDGPCQWPEDRAGIVLCQITDRWGSHAVVLMDDGRTKTCHGLMSGPGIGWHMLTKRGAS